MSPLRCRIPCLSPRFLGSRRRARRHAAGFASKRRSAGETLAETLVAVLIAVLATLVLVTSTVTAAMLNRTAEATDLQQATDLNMVEARTAATQSVAQATVATAEGVLGSYTVTVFEGDYHRYHAYEGVE